MLLSTLTNRYGVFFLPGSKFLQLSVADALDGLPSPFSMHLILFLDLVEATEGVVLPEMNTVSTMLSPCELPG